MGMGSNRLSERNTRALGQRLGLDLWRAWAGDHENGATSIEIVTTDHRHGWVRRRRSGELTEPRWETRPTHYTTCAERFPE